MSVLAATFTSGRHQALLSLLRPLIATLVGLALGLAFTGLAGENPLAVGAILVQSAFGSAYDVGMTLSYATPLLFTGLSVSLAFQAGLFNIGAEGQLAMGAMSATLFALAFPTLPFPIAPVGATLAAFAGGALWGFVPGWLLAKRGGHEVISTIMLNFVAAGITSWIALSLVPNVGSSNPETAYVSEAYRLTNLALFPDTPASTAAYLAIACVPLTWLLVRRTSLGFDMRAVGASEASARIAGARPARTRILALTLAGGVAGLVAVPEILGNAHRFRVGFSPDFGFIGIAVALLGRGHPLAVLPSALLFGALHKGTADLDFQTERVSRDIALVIQALVIASVAADGLWDRVFRARFFARRSIATASNPPAEGPL
jgi:ABC-type uncharacterized transport system permease subunit